MNQHEDDKWVQEFMKDMRKIDVSMMKEAPSKEELTGLLQSMKHGRKQSLKREFILFIITALFISFCYLYIVYNLSSVFIWIQIFSIITMQVIYFIEKKRRREIKE